MKVYLSADMEGVAGIAHWDEATKTNPDYQGFVGQMMREVRAACEGAINAGAQEIWVKDAHDTARNLNHAELPGNVRLIRGWSGHPFEMMQELDRSFDAALMIGYHSFSGSDSSPMAHTLSSKDIASLKLNDETASEFLINALTAALVDVPVVFVSGDEGICERVAMHNKNIKTVATNKGVGNSMIGIHPQLAAEKIKESVGSALRSDFSKCKLTLPDRFKVEISYVDHCKAYKASFYPGMKQVSPTNVVFEAADYFDVLRMFAFVI
jgi:D-amino peptidase